MSLRAIIFGGGGQDGYYLRKQLLTLGYIVYSFTHNDCEFGTILDVSDFNNVCNVIKDIQPHYIFHLAARSSTLHEHIFENQKAIVDGALSILEAVDRYSPDTKIFLASSGLIFKNIGQPIQENNEYVANSAYAMARLEALQIARYYRNKGRKVFVGFLFNHESPLRPPNSVARKIAIRVAEIHLGLQNTLQIGNADVIKEWMWAGDATSAMLQFVGQNNIYEACIGDGVGRSIREFAHACCDSVEISMLDCLVELPEYQVEYPYLVSDSTKIRSLGWAPKMDIQNLAKLMVESEISSKQTQKI